LHCGDPPSKPRRTPRGEQSRKNGENEVVARDNGKVMVLSWMDKWVITMIFTNHDGSTAEAYHREKGSAQRKEVIKLKCVIEYKYMSGVDRVDQMIAYYPCTWKTINWTKKVFFTCWN